MTNAAVNGQDERQSRADANRESKLLAHRELDRLLAVAAAPDFSGRVGVELSVEKGRYGRLEISFQQYKRI